MKNFLAYIFIGILVAFLGMVFAGLFASIFNGLDVGSGCATGIGVYLCIVVVVCTGIVSSKIQKAQSSKEKDI